MCRSARLAATCRRSSRRAARRPAKSCPVPGQCRKAVPAQASVANGLVATSVPSARVHDLEVGEHRRCHVGELPQAFDGQAPDLDVGVLAGAHRDEVPPRPVVAGDDDAGLGRVGQHGSGGLAGLLAPQYRVGLVGELGLEPGQQVVVGGAAGVGGRREDLAQFGVVIDARWHDDPRLALRHVALRQLRVREVPVPDQLVGAGPRDAGDVERHTRVLEHREVPDVDDVLDVAGVGRGTGIRFGPALVAGAAGELDQCRSAVGVGGPRHVRVAPRNRSSRSIARAAARSRPWRSP